MIRTYFPHNQPLAMSAQASSDICLSYHNNSSQVDIVENGRVIATATYATGNEGGVAFVDISYSPSLLLSILGVPNARAAVTHLPDQPEDGIGYEAEANGLMLTGRVWEEEVNGTRVKRESANLYKKTNKNTWAIVSDLETIKELLNSNPKFAQLARTVREIVHTQGKNLLPRKDC